MDDRKLLDSIPMREELIKVCIAIAQPVCYCRAVVCSIPQAQLTRPAAQTLAACNGWFGFSFGFGFEAADVMCLVANH